MDRRKLTLVSLVALLPVVGRAQDKSMRDHLGTRITATPGAIVLDWDVKHPWNPDLSRGALLIAEYDTRNQGVVLQKLATGKAAGNNIQSIRFGLPTELTVPPTGPVCMFIQLTNNRMLPIRKGGSGHAETTRFRDPSWESQAVARSDDTAQRSTLAAFESAAREADRQVELERGEMTRMGVADRASCSSMKAPSFTTDRPFDVLSAAEIPEAARRACITRVRHAVMSMTEDINEAKSDEKVGTMFLHLSQRVMPPDLTSGLLNSVKLPPDAIRTQQLADFQSDWSRFSEHPDTKPHLLLGNEDDDILLQSMTADAGKKLVLLLVYLEVHKPVPSEDLKKIDSADVAGFAGGELEAYSRCVIDSQRQLRNKLDEWGENQRKAPELRESARQQLVAACQNSFTRMDALLTQQKAAHERLDAARAANPAAPVVRDPTVAATILNDLTCSPR